MPSSTDPQQSPTTRWLWWALLVLAGAATIGFGYAVSQRVLYPHELEWMEGALADHASRVANGLPLYCEPQPEHVPFLYAPMLFWLGGLGMKLGLDGIIALRLIAITFSVGSALMIGHWVKRETGKVVPGLVAVGLFFAGYGWLAWWYDLARNDSLFVFLCLATSYQLRYGGNLRWLWAGLLATLALLAKQSALMWLPAVGVGALFWNWRVAVRFGLASAVAMGASIGLMHLISDGWSTFYLFEMPSHHGIVGEHKLAYWTRDILPMLPLFVLGVAGFVRSVKQDTGGALYLAAFGAGGIACSWLSRMHVGGFDNVMMYGFAAACVLGPIAASGTSRWMQIVGPATLLLQFVLLALVAWPTQTLLPSEDHRIAHDELKGFVEQQDGPVWIPGHGHIAYRAGKGSGAHGQAIFDLLQILPPGPGGFDLGALADTAKLTYLSERARSALDSFRDHCSAAIRDRRFATIVLEKEGTSPFEALFAIPLLGDDKQPGSADDPYRRQRIPMQKPTALKPLIGFSAHSPYALMRRE